VGDMNNIIEYNHYIKDIDGKFTKFKSLRDLEKTFPDEKSCIDYLERVIWNNNPVSPFDPTSQVYKCKNGRYKCKNTNEYFNIKTGTIFKNSNLSLRE
jgi:hypothetical protein